MRPNETIVQEDAKIVQTSVGMVFLDDFAMDFGRLFYPLLWGSTIFAAQ